MTPAEYIERQLSNARISLSKAESRNDRHAQLRLRHRIDLLERLKTEAAENSELKQALTDLVQMKVDDCDLCKHNFPRDTCENYDYDCQLCNAIGCTCAACRNNDKFEWRGVIGEPQNPQKNDALQGAMDRLGMFGQLFVDYAGCPRGPMGRMAGASLIDEAMSMDVLVDVDGGRWIPVKADVLHELCKQVKTGKAHPAQHGHWVWFHQIVNDVHGLRAIDGCKCSLCGLGTSGNNFCECCGAKMDDEENDG